MTQKIRNLFKFWLKNEIEKLNNPNCRIEYIFKTAGITEFRSCKNSKIDKLSELIAEVILLNFNL